MTDRRRLRALLAALVLPCAAGSSGCLPPRREPPAATFPAWAYAWDASAPSKVDPALRRVPDSAASFSLARIQDVFFTADWHPADHPPMPDVVAHGRRPDLPACGSCHRADGTGGPDSCKLARLPVDYFVRQMADFKSGARMLTGPPRPAARSVVDSARAATDAEVMAAALYFASLTPRSRLVVVETDTVPVTTVAGYLRVPVPGGATEPLGERILELPEDALRLELHDSRALVRAYVPRGSVARGATIATKGTDRTSACVGCHGPDLRGGGVFPALAGQWPSYVVRQLYEIKAGVRAGPNAAVNMRPVVRMLAMGDLIDVAAYLATLPP